MLKKSLFIMVIVLLFSLAVISVAAADSEPVGDCLPNWHLHQFSEHDHTGSGHGDHLHVGTDADQNGDGYVCGKHVTPSKTVHVHTDNNLPRKD